MDDDKTVKLRSYPGDAKSDAPQSNLTQDQSKALELAKKNAQLEEEKRKSLEQLKIIEQLRESLKQEQANTAEMAKKNAQLEEENKKSPEQLKTLQQLQESLKQEQAKTAEMTKKATALEDKVKELTDVLGKISGIAAAGKMG